MDRLPLYQLGGPFQIVTGPEEFWKERGETSQNFKKQH